MTTDHALHTVAAVDIGSNTFHLAIGQVAKNGKKLTIVKRHVELIRLGADVTKTGAIGEERAARGEATLQHMAKLAKDAGAEVLLGMATEGVRAASNAVEMLSRFGAALGTPVVLLSGLEEAALTFWGAASQADDPLAALAVGDLGGGSCEIVTGVAGCISWACSLPLGSGRLADSLPDIDHPTAADFERLGEQAKGVLVSVAIPPQPVQTLIAVGGTATSLLRLLPHPTANGMLHRDDIVHIMHLLQEQPLTAISQQYSVDIERVRLFTGGSVAWYEILTWLGIDSMYVSERGVREGAMLAWAQAGDGWQQFAHTATGV